jgi:hypothetical protein
MDPDDPTSEPGDEDLSSSDSDVCSLGRYCPFIADVPISSAADPFPIANPDRRTDKDLEEYKKRLRKIIHMKKFESPLPLADFCLIAKEKWESREGDPEASLSICILL